MLFKKQIEKKIKKIIKTLTGINDNFEVFLLITARSSLFSFFQSLNNDQERTIILIPDYVCNIVEKSIRNAGYKNIIFYKIDDNLLPNEEDLENKIKQFFPDIVVFAPIFGSYGETYYQLMKKTHEYGPMIILDFAQDFEITIPAFVSVAVTSFNQKSINGFFGGVLIINTKLLKNYQKNFKKLSIREEYNYLKIYVSRKILSLFKKFMKNKHRPIRNKIFDYSFCQEGPYRFTQNEISFISLIVALIEIKKIKKYYKIREKNYEIIKKWLDSHNGIILIETNHINHSPYIPIKVENPETISQLYEWLVDKRMKLKLPYGKDSNINKSEKESLFAIETGFYKIK